MKPSVRRARFAVHAAAVAAATLALGCGVVDRMVGVTTACDLAASGVAARAEILALWDTGISVNDEPVVGMHVRVLAEDRPQFEADIPRSLIGRLQVPQVQPGMVVPVVYDPNDTTRVGLDVYRCR